MRPATTVPRLTTRPLRATSISATKGPTIGMTETTGVRVLVTVFQGRDVQ